MYISTYIHIYIYTYIYICTYLHIYIYTYIHIYIYTYIHIYIYIYTYIHRYIYTYIYIYTYTYIHIHIYISTYVHMYIYTYIHIYIYNVHMYLTCRYMYIYIYWYVDIDIDIEPCFIHEKSGPSFARPRFASTSPSFAAHAALDPTLRLPCGLTSVEASPSPRGWRAMTLLTLFCQKLKSIRIYISIYILVHMYVCVLYIYIHILRKYLGVIKQQNSCVKPTNHGDMAMSWHRFMVFHCLRQARRP